MTTRGLINCSIDGRGTHAPMQTNLSPIFAHGSGDMIQHAPNEMFVTLYNFLNSSQAQSLGIQRRAFNQGGATANLCYPMVEERTSSFAGSGMNYWDETNPVGNHAWAAFEFTKGSPAFWVTIQWGGSAVSANGVGGENYWADVNAFGQSGSIGTIGVPYLDTSAGSFSANSLLTSSATKFGGVGIAVGMMNDGSSPWNGTTVNSGTDTKGKPAWAPNAMVWPRASNDRGLFSANRELMFGLLWEQNVAFKTWGGIPGVQLKLTNTGFIAGNVPTYDQSDILYHTIIEEDKICILSDMMGCGHYNLFYFGPYTPYQTGSIAPRIALSKFVNNNDDAPILTVGTNRVYGGFDMGFMYSGNQYDDQTMGETSYFQGGVSHPLSATVVGVSIDTIPYNSIFDNPRRYQSEAVAPWLLTNPIVYMNEYPERRALLGEITWFSLTTNCRSHSLFNTGTLAAFGNPEMGSYKVIVPWFTGSIPGIYGTRRGFIR